MLSAEQIKKAENLLNKSVEAQQKIMKSRLTPKSVRDVLLQYRDDLAFYMSTLISKKGRPAFNCVRKNGVVVETSIPEQGEIDIAHNKAWVITKHRNAQTGEGRLIVSRFFDWLESEKLKK